MDDNEFLEDRRRALKESVEYFSEKNKPERERRVCTEFLTNLGIAFDPDEVVSWKDEPPDIVFRDARFEIKEILDQGRRRHAEYKVAFEKALKATDPQDFLVTFTPKDIDPSQIADRIRRELGSIAHHYPGSVRANLDLMFYVNLQDCSFKPEPMPEVALFASYGWRSISALNSWVSLVFFTATDAPALLRSKAGTLIQRKFQ